jgi:hypothetical protein
VSPSARFAASRVEPAQQFQLASQLHRSCLQTMTHGAASVMRQAIGVLAHQIANDFGAAEGHGPGQNVRLRLGRQALPCGSDRTGDREAHDREFAQGVGERH